MREIQFHYYKIKSKKKTNLILHIASNALKYIKIRLIFKFFNTPIYASVSTQHFSNFIF